MASNINHDINLRDYIWETEEHRFEPKENRHAAVLSGKKKEAAEKTNLSAKKANKRILVNSQISNYKSAKASADWIDNISETAE